MTAGTSLIPEKPALIEGVNELPGQGVPLLEQEGWLRLHKEASQHLLDGAATPPLRGGEHPSLQFIHTFIERRTSLIRGSRRSQTAATVSEHEFQRQLDDAIVARRQSVVPADVVRDLPKVRSSEGNLTASLSPVGPVTRSEWVQVVRKVEGFRAQLNRLAFPDRKRPGQRHVQLENTRSLQGVIPQVAVCSRRRFEESRGIDPS